MQSIAPDSTAVKTTPSEKPKSGDNSRSTPKPTNSPLHDATVAAIVPGEEQAPKKRGRPPKSQAVATAEIAKNQNIKPALRTSPRLRSAAAEELKEQTKPKKAVASPKDTLGRKQAIPPSTATHSPLRCQQQQSNQVDLEQSYRNHGSWSNNFKLFLEFKEEVGIQNVHSRQNSFGNWALA